MDFVGHRTQNIVANEPNLVILTGQSSRISCELPENQQSFLQKMAGVGIRPLYLGYPWDLTKTLPRDRPNLLLASIRNLSQFIKVRFSRKFRTKNTLILRNALSSKEVKGRVKSCWMYANFLTFGFSDLPNPVTS
jgi:hypothetical protein